MSGGNKELRENKPDFKVESKEHQFVVISYGGNEAQIFDIKDHTGDISITLFGICDLRGGYIHAYRHESVSEKNTSLFKTVDLTKVKITDDEISVNKENMTESNHDDFKGTISNVEINSVVKNQQCQQCRATVKHFSNNLEYHGKFQSIK